MRGLPTLSSGKSMGFLILFEHFWRGLSILQKKRLTTGRSFIFLWVVTVRNSERIND